MVATAEDAAKFVFNFCVSRLTNPPGGGALAYKRLIGMCRWMGSHFHDCIDYNGITFLVELLEWGRTFSGFLGEENSGKQGFKNRKICG